MLIKIPIYLLVSSDTLIIRIRDYGFPALIIKIRDYRFPTLQSTGKGLKPEPDSKGVLEFVFAVVQYRV